MSRGLRNNNPGNLRHGSQWDGLAIEQTDTDFCQFSHAVFGIRALTRLLQNYQKRYKLFTVVEIINRFAPTVENNTNAYIDHVCQMTGFRPMQAINLSVRANMERLVKAIIMHENGLNPYTYELRDGITLGMWE